MNKILETPIYPYRRSPDQDAEKPARHPVVIIGAGPVGLTAAIDLALSGIPVVVLDENDRVSFGSRAICFAKRSLEILDRLGCADGMVEKGITWNTGKVFFGEREVFQFNLLPEEGHRRPAFINLQQYYFEFYLVQRLRELQAEGKPVEIRGKNRLISIETGLEHVAIGIETPEGVYQLESEWLIACDGAKSPIRQMMGLDFRGQSFEDNFLIADVIMEAGFPAERRFWFDPSFNRGQSALLHKQPDNVWRIDLQLGRGIDREGEKEPERVIPRIKAMLGDEVDFELEWLSIYNFHCRRMEKFRHGRVIFAGDAAHQVSPFGARGANSGIQDSENLAWKLKLVLDGFAPETLLDSYDAERIQAADENLLNSTRSTDFITPKSEISQVFRDAVLSLAGQYEFARPLVNSGRLSAPCIYDHSPLNGPDCFSLPARTRPGAPASDAPVGNGWLLDHLGGGFRLLAVDADAPDRINVNGLIIEKVSASTAVDPSGCLRARYLGEAPGCICLVRPDQHIAARWTSLDVKAIRDAALTASGHLKAH